ncbi:MAG: cysteine desulfurase [Candidatus Omnitrophica bacterium]|nr:cysteine desulfurase [Candidatus Omnitrophota bacterium]
MNIYLDNAATTKLYPEVIEEMLPYQEVDFGNASSINKLGIRSAKAIEKARLIISKAINANPEEIFFSSGGTESNNSAIIGIAFANKKKGNHIITSAIEHPSIHEVTKWIETQGFEVTYLPVDREGFINPHDVEKAIEKKTVLVSIMQANNEIGTIEPIFEIGKICKEKEVYFHSDACQSLTKTELDVRKQYLDIVTLNAHKIHGPKGVGAIFIKKGTNINPLLHGGGQENNFRSGTYNTPGIVGFGKAVEISNQTDVKEMIYLRDCFIQRIRDNIEDVLVNGPEGEKRLSNNINLIFKNVNGKSLFLELNKRDIFISTGSACSSAELMPSRVLIAIGHNPETANGAIRISTSKFTTKEELDFVVENIIDIVKKERGK